MCWFVKPCRRQKPPSSSSSSSSSLASSLACTLSRGPAVVVHRLLLTCCCALVVLPLLGGSSQYGGAATTQDYQDGEDEDIDVTTEENNSTDGQYLGSPCAGTCDPRLPNVFCDPVTRHCECDKKYPVKLGPTRGCAKPVRLGDQCFYGATCTFTDQHAACIQIHHNAICQCKPGYHSVAVARPVKRVFCSEDLLLLTTDMPTLFGVATGIALFTGLICFVLKLFSSARYTRPRHYANAGLAPPILFSSDTGSRRPSLASVHSNTSSVRSFSMRRYERENQQRELRQQQIQDSLRLSAGCKDREVVAPMPSPKTPMSTDELLPSVSEGEEGYSMPISGPSNATSIHVVTSGYQGEIGPCTSSDHQ